MATFGQPDEVVPIGEGDGLCPTESGRAARFGWLTALFRDEAGREVLVAYRVESPPTGGEGHGTSIVRTAERGGDPFLLLLRSSDERTLLWGPLSGDDPPVVTGIYSPRPCDGGPFG